MSDDLVKHLDLVNKVATEYLKGLDSSEISKQLDLPRTKIMALLNDWRAMISNNQAINIRAKEALAGADQHYQLLIKDAWHTADEAEQAGQLNAKIAALKLIADIESKRIDMLNKAGVLESNSMADQIIETERKQEILVGILKDVTVSCDHCKWEVSKRLSEVTGKLEAVQVNLD